MLESVLRAQRLCPYDIEGVYHLYRSLLGDGGAADDAFSHRGPPEGRAAASAHAAAGHADALLALRSLPRGEALEVLRSYCVAATAKDCAVMIAIQLAEGESGGLCARRQGGGGGGGGCGVAAVGGGPDAAWCRYRLTLVDLDRKALAKIPRHRQLDLHILQAASASGA